MKGWCACLLQIIILMELLCIGFLGFWNFFLGLRGCDC